MTRNRGVPDRQPPGKPPKRGEGVSQPVSSRKAGAKFSRPNDPKIPTKASLTQARSAKHSLQESQSDALKARARLRNGVVAATSAGDRPPKQFTSRHPLWWLSWLADWRILIVLAIFICSSSGIFAAALLFRLPGLPNCPAIFWPLAPASLRFECARLAASKQTTKDLLEAIELLNALPANHPLRAEADRLIALWAEEVLRLAEDIFNEGKLPDAISAARRIPSQAPAYKLVEQRVKRWESIWAEAEKIYQKAENELRQREWSKAFSQATRLLSVENKYWQTKKYDELVGHINTARIDGNQLYKAERLADDGDPKSLLEAIKLAQTIRPTSYVYQEAQKAIARFGRKMLNLAQTLLEQRDIQGAQDLISKIPNIGSLKEEAKDMSTLANAYSTAWRNNVAGLEDAIYQAQRIGSDRPLYKKAQKLIARWQFEIEGVAQLDKARSIAQAGSINDLSAAIAEANLVPSSNPRRSEAIQQMQTWRNQIQTIEDRPILDVADQLASQGGTPALEAAIAQASQVAQGRALYQEAQGKIGQWTAQIQRTQNQPYLDQAEQYANAGDLAAAIATARQIPRGQALYDEAQANIRKWQQTIQTAEIQAQSERTLQEARRLANPGTPDALASAIQLAGQVPAASGLRAEARNSMNQWSWQLYQLAVDRAGYDLPGAIAIAQKVPSGTDAYSQAQQQIQTWSKVQNQGR